MQLDLYRAKNGLFALLVVICCLRSIGIGLARIMEKLRVNAAMELMRDFMLPVASR